MQEPFLSILGALQRLSPSLDGLALQCVLPHGTPEGQFMVSQMLLPIGIILALVCYGACSKLLRYAMVDWSRILNSIGSMVMLVFISLTLMSFSPLICLKNPNGSSTIKSNPSVQCWVEEHVQFLIASVVAILVYPVLVQGLVLRAVVSYPSAVVSNRATGFMRTYQSLFRRYRKERYYYCGIFMLRSFVIALIPVVFANNPVVQVLSLVCSYWVFSCFSSSCGPGVVKCRIGLTQFLVHASC